MPRYTTYFLELPARQIFGSVGRSGGGYNSVWSDWTPQGRQNRELIMAEYEKAMDDLCGHYRLLEQSILQEGFRSPIIVTCGYPRRRSMEQLPPELRSQSPNQILIMESLTGGSRLWAAQKHDMTIPCLVNDWTGRFLGNNPILTIQQARACYTDPPQGLAFDHRLGLVESFDQRKVGHHLGEAWREDILMPQRSPIWIGIMNRYGYRIDRLPDVVVQALAAQGFKQN